MIMEEKDEEPQRKKMYISFVMGNFWMKKMMEVWVNLLLCVVLNGDGR